MRDFSDEPCLSPNVLNCRSTISGTWSNLGQVRRGIALMQRLVGRLVYLGGVWVIALTSARLLFLDVL